VDWNSDGRKDLVVGEPSGKIRIYLNVGTDAAPVFDGFSFLRVGGSDFVAGGGCSAPEAVDWNHDGRKDVVCGSFDGRVYLLLNTGTDANPQFAASTPIQSAGAAIQPGTVAHPAIVDWNGDGKKDLLVGHNGTGGSLLYYENKGTDAAPVFGGCVPLSTVSQSYNRPKACDWDNDGTPDLLVGSSAHVLHYRAHGPGQPHLAIAGTFVDDSMGDGNGVLDTNETVHLVVALRNTQFRAENVTGMLSCDNPCVEILHSNAVFGVIEKGRTARNFRTPFSLRLAGGQSPTGIYRFNLDVRWTGAPAPVRLSFYVGGYRTDDQGTCEWIDTSDGAAIPLARGEVSAPIDLGFDFPYYHKSYRSLRVKTGGTLLLEEAHDTAGSVDPIPYPSRPNAVIAPFWHEALNPELPAPVRHKLVGTAPSRQWVVEWNGLRPDWPTNQTATFQAILGEQGGIRFQYLSAPAGVQASVGLEAPDGREGVQHSYLAGAVSNGLAIDFTPVPIQCERFPYSTDDAVAPSWIDMSDGTSLPLGTQAMVTNVSLGFGFPFFGQTHNAVHVDKNGYVTLGEPFHALSVPWALPRVDKPNPLIAPFCADLNTSAGGGVRYKRLGTAPNRRWAVEWTRVPARFSEGTTSFTFQAVLFESGRIMFQYGPMVSPTAGYPVIGIESPDGRCGVLYGKSAFDVTNGLAIMFDPISDEPDRDADGLPDLYEYFCFGRHLDTSDGATDSDGDGMSNRREWLSGTDPLDAASALRVEKLAAPDAGSWVLEWQSVRGRFYRIERSPDLAAGSWVSLTPAPVLSAGTSCAYTTQVSWVEQAGFFRVRIP
jgi:hypothetical protein